MRDHSNLENIEHEKIIDWIDEKIFLIQSDERFQSKPASIFSNAPLALLQASLTAEKSILEQVKEKLIKAEIDEVDDNELPFI